MHSTSLKFYICIPSPYLTLLTSLSFPSLFPLLILLASPYLPLPLLTLITSLYPLLLHVYLPLPTGAIPPYTSYLVPLSSSSPPPPVLPLRLPLSFTVLTPFPSKGTRCVKMSSRSLPTAAFSSTPWSTATGTSCVAGKCGTHFSAVMSSPRWRGCKGFWEGEVATLPPLLPPPPLPLLPPLACSPLANRSTCFANFLAQI